jgi:hypothetical protein
VNRRILAIAALIVGSAAGSGCTQPSDSLSSNPWTVVSVRERHPGEVPFEESSRYMWPSPDKSNVPGPDSLIARVRTDEQLHAHLEIENLRTGETYPLLDASAFLPRWSPNGKYISCAVWKSPGQTGELTVVGVATRIAIIDPELRASGRTSKWSPDSRMLAAAGVMYGCPRTLLYTVTVPDGKTTVIDTLDVLSDYEFSWSPNARWIAFSRPSVLDPVGGDPIAADLWIAEAETGRKWPLVVSSDWVEANPLWITNETIQIDRAICKDSNLGAEQRVVVELSSKEDRRRPPK